MTTPALEVEHATVRFGGLVAVNDVSLSVPERSVIGLIGPNGAGKTTLFNVCTGLQRPVAGRVRFWGEDVGTLGPAHRARRGVGRTFQVMELFDSLTVAQNVAMGREGTQAGGSVLRQMLARRGERDEMEAAAHAALRSCGIEDLATQTVGLLSTGQRRLVELARVLAGPFRLLLLDEPSSGLDARETEDLRNVLRSVVEERGLSIFLVEHDMRLVLNTCDHIYLLDFGRLVFEGSADDVRSSDVVRAAYLGSEVA